MYGVCVARKPWLLITEFMRYKDLGYVLQKAKRCSIALRIHELMFFSVQIAESLKYLEDVGDLMLTSPHVLNLRLLFGRNAFFIETLLYATFF